ncbi:MAG TPA: hypothetical protein VFH14_03170 [Gemmatimonadaceae bacterium]|nr:hypothetical protein [Gemmatimonadaceae bacterium]
MKALFLAAAWLVIAPGRLLAQVPELAPDSARGVREALARDPFGARLDENTPISVGDRVVAPGEVISGAAVTARGDLIVSGSVGRDAIAVGGDVIVRQGGVIGGDAVAVDGRVRLEGGTVRGETRTIGGPLGLTPATATQRSALSAMWHQLLLALGWLAILAAIGVVVVLFARTNLEGVADAIERNFGRAFLVGIAAELAVLPALLMLIVVLLLIPIVGWALLPFAVIGFLVAIAGALALGFLAMAQVTGEALMRRAQRGAGGLERVVFVGLVAYMSLWIVTALLAWSGPAGGVMRIIALLLTWVAATVGFGATLVSRGGTGEPTRTSIPLTRTAELEWQTPTPVVGVAAARRPTPAPRSGIDS